MVDLSFVDFQEIQELVGYVSGVVLGMLFLQVNVDLSINFGVVLVVM